jgi:hypothetical protein
VIGAGFWLKSTIRMGPIAESSGPGNNGFRGRAVSGDCESVRDGTVRNDPIFVSKDSLNTINDIVSYKRNENQNVK